MKMFLSIDQVGGSLPLIADLNPFFGMSFLAFKAAELPVGAARPLNFSRSVQGILDRHYKPASEYAGFYNPFRTSDQSNRWLAPRYGSTSLQRITTDTFADTLIHKKGEASWGWRVDYVKKLKAHLGGHLIPAFHLGIWLYRNEAWLEDALPKDIIRRLRDEYRLTRKELDSLFDERAPKPNADWMSPKPIPEGDLLAVIGNPPGWAPPAGAAVRFIEIREVGPAKLLRYEPADRLNIITGNNSLGKTFLLECLWWALTGDWLEYPALPRRDVAKGRPKRSEEHTSELQSL